MSRIQGIDNRKPEAIHYQFAGVGRDVWSSKSPNVPVKDVPEMWRARLDRVRGKVDGE